MWKTTKRDVNQIRSVDKVFKSIPSQIDVDLCGSFLIERRERGTGFEKAFTSFCFLLQVVRDRRFNDKPQFIYLALTDVLGKGLLTASGEYWKRHRALTQPTFHLKVLERFVDVFAEEAVHFVERMKTRVNSDVDFADEMHLVTGMSVLRTTVTRTINENDKENMEVRVEMSIVVDTKICFVLISTYAPVRNGSSKTYDIDLPYFHVEST